jgi:hypothetical protein
MEPRIGIAVTDKSGESIGTIDYVMRDTWSGEIKKCMIYRQPPDKDIVFSIDDIAETTENLIKLNLSKDELLNSQDSS